MSTSTYHFATHCNEVLKRYTEDFDEVTNLVYFLADARHWCDRNQESFAGLDRQAYQLYIGELADSDKR